MGSTSLSSGSMPVHHVNDAEMQKIIEGLLPGSPYDYLWVSRTEDEYGGVSLGKWKGELELSASFNTHAEREEIRSFREAMNAAGFNGAENSDSFSGGISEECRSTNFDYVLPEEIGEIFRAIEAALGNLYPGYVGGFFVQADCFTAKHRKGRVSYKAYADYLAPIVGRPGERRSRRKRPMP